MASISSLGIGSGLDLNGLLNQLNEAERGKLEPIEQQIKDQQVKISAYGELKGALSGFQSSAGALSDASLYESLSASVSGGSVQAAATAEAAPGQYEVYVEQLASAGTLATQRVDDADTVLTDSDTMLSLSFTDSDLDHAVAIAADSTLEDVRDAINADSEAAVSASLVNDGEGYRLALTSAESGKQASLESTDFDSVASQAAPTGSEIVQAGTDAALKINGIDISSANNQVEDAIQGVTLNLTGEGASTVAVERDTAAVRDAVTGFVDNFNALKGTMGELTAFDAESGEAGDLLGDSAVRSVEARLRSVLAGGVESAEGGIAMLSDIGISLTLDGTMEVDQQQLDAAIATDQDALGEFFAGGGSAEGLAGRLDQDIAQLIQDNGALGGAISGAEGSIGRLNDRYVQMEQGIEGTLERYRQQFSQLDGMIADMNQTSNYLTQQLSSLPGQNGGGGGMGML